MILKKYYIKRGFTIIELIAAITLSSLIMILIFPILNITLKSMDNTEINNSIVRHDTEILAEINEVIRKSATSFTIPRDSFTIDKLTENWDYIGMMSDVYIPAESSMTGKEILSTNAFVYIEYYGKTAPQQISKGANLINNSEGYFIQNILSHDFIDHNNISHKYSLVFLPTEKDGTTKQNIRYEFKSISRNESGEIINSERGVQADSFLNSLNAVQVVYNGSNVNPAVAIAFNLGYIPTDSATQENPAATVTMVLDLSGSMSNTLGSERRVDALKATTKNFVESLSVNNNIDICIIPFSAYGTHPSNYSGGTPTKHIYNASADKDQIINIVDRLRPTGSTNVGDGLRVAYFELLNFRETHKMSENHFIILMTDGAMNAFSTRRSGIVNPDFYLLKKTPPSRVYAANANTYKEHAREYMKIFGKKIKDEFSPKIYLISLSNGMSTEDESALKEVFESSEKFDANSLADLDDVFEAINNNISEVIWALEGPKL